MKTARTILSGLAQLYNDADVVKEETKMKTKEIAEKSNLPERTITRVFSGETDSPYADTLHRIVKAMGGSLDDVLADTKTVLGANNLATLQEKVETLQADLDSITAERDLLSVELSLLKDKYNALSAELDLLKLKLAHKDEIIALHNYYNKLNK